MTVAFAGGPTSITTKKTLTMQLGWKCGTLQVSSCIVAQHWPERSKNPFFSSLPLERSGYASVLSSGNVPVRVLSRPYVVDGQPVVIRVARSAARLRDELKTLLLVLGFGFPIAVGIAACGGYALARRALAPVGKMADRARTITAERLGERLPVITPDDELGHLATVFNETFARIERSFEQLRRFTADASHELRTPLTAIRSVGEVGLREHHNERAYREIIGSMLEEADQLGHLVESLLTLSRADAGQVKLRLERLDLAELAREIVNHLGVLAEEKRQSLSVEAAAGVYAREIASYSARPLSIWLTMRSSTARRAGRFESSSGISRMALH